MITRKLHSLGILPSEIIASETTIRNLELDKKRYLKRLGIPVNAIRENRVVVEYPAIFLIDEKDEKHDPHVWFCSSEGDYQLNNKKHIVGTSEIKLICPLKKEN